MKFLGEPNMLIRMNYRHGLLSYWKTVGRFDKDGVFETDDEKIIKRMQRNFPVSESKELRHCKKCDFTCENQGELLAHYRTAHPKGEQNVTEPTA